MIIFTKGAANQNTRVGFSALLGDRHDKHKDILMRV
jgi:hypothetical protein